MTMFAAPTICALAGGAGVATGARKTDVPLRYQPNVVRNAPSTFFCEPVTCSSNRCGQTPSESPFAWKYRTAAA